MYRLLPGLLLVVGLIAGQSFGDQPNATAAAPKDGDISTLRLYFAPDAGNVQGGFKPEVARIFADEAFVGHAIINVQGEMPTLRFGAGLHTIRVELGDRKFQTEITLLGKDSKQILYVDFDNPAVTAQQSQR